MAKRGTRPQCLLRWTPWRSVDGYSVLDEGSHEGGLGHKQGVHMYVFTEVTTEKR